MDNTYRRRPKAKITTLILLAIVIHVLLLLNVLNIYFTSPLENGLTHHKPIVSKPLAKRLVLFIADGLRARALYKNDMRHSSPFLYKMSTGEGSWGIAHTQVPTESRPGHVALTAGFYEDPSAIFKGWQHNPVDFDTVINQSRKAVCFGSPDIVHMFNKYNYSHIESFAYDPNWEDFSGKKETVILDQWVFNTATKFIKEENRYSSAKTQLFLFHLLGIDTAGHSFKPHSKEYNYNIEVVDKEISDFHIFFNNHFNDNQSTFIFTSDHGMTDWGSHGAGSKDETEVPIIVWGSGINKSEKKININLNDIAPLISSVLGINYPINSLGITPTKLLNASKQDLANILFANTLQLSELYLAKEDKIRKNPIIMFKPFKFMINSTLIQCHNEIKDKINLKLYEDVISLSPELSRQLYKGILYYNSYFQTYLSIISGVAFLGWIVYLLSWLPIFSTLYINFKDNDEWSAYKISKRSVSNMFIIINVIFLIIAKVIGFLYYHILYVIFPIVCWYLVFIRFYYIKILYKWLIHFKTRELFLFTFSFASGIEMLIWTFYSRQALIPVILANVFYTWKFSNMKYNLVWSVSSIVICGTLFLPIMNTGFSTSYLVVSLLLCSLFLGLIIFYVKKNDPLGLGFFKRVPTLLQIIVLFGAYLNTFIVKLTIGQGYGLHLFNQIFSWSTLGAAIVLPLFAPVTVGHRLISIIMGLIPVYILLSGGIEPIFLILFIFFTSLWVLVEQQISNQYLDNIWKHSFKSYASLSIRDYKEDIRRAFAFFSFVLLAFFGTGNLNSINSFDPTWTQTFVTVYKPFLMTSLIALKITIPFLILMCCFAAIVKMTNMEIRHVFILLLFFCDLMVFQFFFAVKNQGSWLEIGMSLSHFIIALVTTLTVLLFYGVSKILTCATIDEVLAVIFRKKYQAVSFSKQNC